MIWKHVWLFVVIPVLVGLPQPLFAEIEETSVPSIELERAVHFMTPEEVDVIVPPGFYAVEATENGLQLVRGFLPDEVGETFFIQAKPGTHEKPLGEPIARSIAVEEDAHYLTLLLPDGRSLEVIGSYSGVRLRGAGWFKRFSRKAKSKLAAVKNRLKVVKGWNRQCKKRYTKTNDVNNCCASKYNSCKRVCRKKSKQRISCQRKCETFNESCWIKKAAKPHWMGNYCRSTKNQRKVQTKNQKACCQKMKTRCKQSCRSFPKSGRAEFCGRCKKAATLCLNGRPETLNVKETPIKTSPGPLTTNFYHFLEDRWGKKTRYKNQLAASMTKLDEEEGLAILRSRLLKPAHKAVKTLADFTKNPLRPNSVKEAKKELKKVWKAAKTGDALAGWPLALGKSTLAGILDVFIANEAKNVAHNRRVMYRLFSEGVVSVLDPSFNPEANSQYDAFIKMGIGAAKSFTDLDLEKYQVAMALIRQSCHRGMGGYCPFDLNWYKNHWDSSTFLEGMKNEYLRNEWSIH